MTSDSADPPPAGLTPRQSAKIQRLMAAFDARMKVENDRAAKLEAGGSDYSGREQLVLMMKRLGRA